MRFFHLFTLTAILILSCKKDKKSKTEISEKSFVKQILYFDDFSGVHSWEPTPSGQYKPGKTCVRLENNLLKLSFDELLQDCGCTWVGARNNDLSVSTNQILDKIGIKVKLNKGYFQNILTYFYTTDINGVITGEKGDRISHSNFRFEFNGLNFEIPHPSAGRIHKDSIFNPNIDKLEGVEFEIIYNKGEKIFKIDGISQSLNLIYFNYSPMVNKHLDIEFSIGHQPEFSSSIDELYIDEIEIYTWKGELIN